jgi:hypothetical protein
MNIYIYEYYSKIPLVFQATIIVTLIGWNFLVDSTKKTQNYIDTNAPTDAQ